MVKSKKALKPLEKTQNLAWIPEVLLGVLGLVVWTGSFYHQGVSLAGAGDLWARGASLILTALGILKLFGCRSFASRFFPVVWIAISGALWNLCAPANVHYWAWEAAMAIGTLTLLTVRDFRVVLGVTACLVAWMTSVMTGSLLMPLAFLFVPKEGKARTRKWFRWGGVAITLVIFLAFQAWKQKGFLQSGWLDAYDFLTARLFLPFVILSLLAWVGFATRKPGRIVLLQLAGVLLGWFFWEPGSLSFAPQAALGVAFMGISGVGLETMKTKILDDSWHGRLVWAALGVSVFLGLFKGT